MEKSWSQSCCPAEASLPRLPCWLLPAQPLGVIRQSQLGLGAQHGLHRPAEGRGQVRALTTVWAPCQARSGCWTRARARSGAWVGGLSWQRPRVSAGLIVFAGLPALGKRCPVSFPHIPLCGGPAGGPGSPRVAPGASGNFRAPPALPGNPPARAPAGSPVTVPTLRPEQPHGLGGVRAPARQGRTRADLFAARPPPRSLCGLEPAGGSGGTGASAGPSAPPTTRAPIGCPGRWAWPRRDRPEPALPRGQER